MAKETAFEEEVKQAVATLKRKDKKLAKIITKNCDLSFPKKVPNSFDTLVHIIGGQQLSGKAAATIFGRVKALARGKALTTKFMNGLKDEQLRSAGVSRPKIRAIHSLTECIYNGSLRLRRFPYMDNDEVFEAITQVKGLGPWSAQIYLMFILRRLDVFPPGDLGIRKAIAKLYNFDADEEACLKIAEKWRQYRTIASMYLWRSLDIKPEVS